MRKIGDTVPEHYMPQIQLSLEVFDLEVCHFVQYRPPKGEFEPMELERIIVQRDRQWFEKNLPVMQHFISDLENFKESYDSYVDEVLDRRKRDVHVVSGGTRAPSTKKKRKTALDTYMFQDFDEVPPVPILVSPRNDLKIPMDGCLVAEFAEDRR